MGFTITPKVIDSGMGSVPEISARAGAGNTPFLVNSECPSTVMSIWLRQARPKASQSYGL